jgi:hypothetical protein
MLYTSILALLNVGRRYKRYFPSQIAIRCVDVGDIEDVSEERIASIFSIAVCKLSLSVKSISRISILYVEAESTSETSTESPTYTQCNDPRIELTTYALLTKFLKLYHSSSK